MGFLSISILCCSVSVSQAGGDLHLSRINLMTLAEGMNLRSLLAVSEIIFMFIKKRINLYNVMSFSCLKTYSYLAVSFSRKCQC